MGGAWSVCPLIARLPQRCGGCVANGRASRRKGSAGELEVAKVFQAHGFDVRRTPNSGGLVVKGDLIGLDGYSVEVKRCERLAVPAWLRQAHRDAGVGEVPLLAFRTSATLKMDPLSRWNAVLPLEEVARLIARDRELAELLHEEAA